MIFSSIEFIIFFVIFILSLKLFKKYQSEIIIYYSIFFYGFWDLKFTLLILYLLFFTYYFLKKKINLKISIICLLLPLFYFKYSFFFVDLIELNFLKNFSYNGNLPLGISFISFTCIAAIVDIHLKSFNKEEINLKNFSQFILYFPQLIAGPILRLKDLLYIFNQKILFDQSNLKFGLILFLIGFIKKIYFADTIGNYIDPIFLDVENVNPLKLHKAFLLFPIQIYFDFSGYVDMALGISNCLSIKLPINFNKPYLTSSLTEFWRNWHITLSNWFRDYIYIPLGGSKKRPMVRNINLILTMSIAGLWHGASLNFILWGFLNGLILALEKYFKFHEKKNNIKIIINCFIVFNLWIIFRIQDFNILINFFIILFSNFLLFFEVSNILVLIFVVLLIFTQKFEDINKIYILSKKLKFSYIVPFFIVVLFIGFAMNAGQSDKFIYFDF